MMFLHFALLVENIEDIPMIVSCGQETLEIQFSDEDKLPWVCEMLYQAFAKFERNSKWWQNNKCYQWPVAVVQMPGK